jgi:type IV secretion system protein TrbD
MNEEETPIRHSLTRPILLFGADREMILLSGVLIGLLIFMSLSDYIMLLIIAPASLILLMMILWCLRNLAKADPLYRKVYIRARKIDSFIPHSSTPYRKR